MCDVSVCGVSLCGSLLEMCQCESLSEISECRLCETLSEGLSMADPTAPCYGRRGAKGLRPPGSHCSVSVPICLWHFS